MLPPRVSKDNIVNLQQDVLQHFCSRPAVQSADFLSLSSRDTCKTLFIKRSYPLRHRTIPFNVHSFGQVIAEMTVHSLVSTRSRLEIGMLLSLCIYINYFQMAFCVSHYTKCNINEYQAGKLHSEIKTNGKNTSGQNCHCFFFTALSLPVYVCMCKEESTQIKGYMVC